MAGVPRVSRRRIPAEEGARLHRAKRAAELDLRDTVLKVADKGLQEVEVALAQAALAATCRPERAAERIARAQETIRTLRKLLVTYYDNEEYSVRPDLR